MQAPGKLEAAVALGPKGDRGVRGVMGCTRSDGATTDDSSVRTHICRAGLPNEPDRLLPIPRPFVSGIAGGTTVDQNSSAGTLAIAHSSRLGTRLRYWDLLLPGPSACSVGGSQWWPAAPPRLVGVR